MPPGGAHDGDGVGALGARERRQVVPLAARAAHGRARRRARRGRRLAGTPLRHCAVARRLREECGIVGLFHLNHLCKSPR